MRWFFRVSTGVIVVFGAASFAWADPSTAPVWAGLGGDAQHTGLSTVGSQALDEIKWTTPVDLAPQFDGNDLLIHYGSPVITGDNTVIVPVKTGASGGFEVSAVSGANGASKWTQTSDYVLPSHDWTPSYGPTLTPNQTLYYAGAGGTLFKRSNVDAYGAVTPTRVAFYGIGNYDANSTSYNNSVFIDTPLTSDAGGNVYFGFTVQGSAPGGLTSGIAKIAPDGTGTWVSASAAAGDGSITKVAMNAAPAISNDGSHVYVTVSNGSSGDLVSLNTSDLSTADVVALKDPVTGAPSWINDDSSAAPVVGPDGDVYVGVLENPFPENHDRGWLLHFSGDLQTAKTTGAFGWDDTPSVVPASMIPGYSGTSSYLLMSKYNNYAGVGGNGQNAIAILDPNATGTDGPSGQITMKVVMSILGVTADSEFPDTPGAVREWCINNAVVDPATDSILVNSEDGSLYRWDLSGGGQTGVFSQSISLTGGVGEAYTPTIIGADGKVYAINDGILFAVGVPEPPAALLILILSGFWVWRRDKKGRRAPKTEAIPEI